MPRHQHVRFAYGERLGVQLLTIELHRNGRVQLFDFRLCDREHTTRTAAGIVDLPDDAALGRQGIILVVGKQQGNDQTDDLAGGVVLSRCLIGNFGKFPDQVLEQIPHLKVGNDVGVRVDLAELLEDREEQSGLVQPFQLIGEEELLKEDVPNIG